MGNSKAQDSKGVYGYCREFPILWSQIPETAIVSHKSNVPEHNMGTYCRLSNGPFHKRRVHFPWEALYSQGRACVEGARTRSKAKCPAVLRAPQDHINRRILRSGSKAKDKRDFRNHGL